MDSLKGSGSCASDLARTTWSGASCPPEGKAYFWSLDEFLLPATYEDEDYDLDDM